MRRWNGWGDDGVEVHLPEGTDALLERALGPGAPAPDVGFERVCRSVPASRLPAHALVDRAPEVRARYARGQSLPDLIALRSGRGLTFPDGVARPASEAEVRTLLELARGGEVALIPYGGGTSVVGHVNPPAGGAPALTVSLERLASLASLDADSRLATLGAGVTGPALEAALRARGFTLGHYPQSFEYSTLGGWIATRSSGQQSLGYGRIEQLFAGGTVLSPEGMLELPPFPATAAGPDLRQLVLGSEGRAGVITEAIVRVTPVPEAERFHGVFFRDWPAALGAARALAQSGLPLSIVRVSTPEETTVNLTLAGRGRGARLLGLLLRLRRLGEGRCVMILGASGSARRVRATSGEALSLARHHGGVTLGRAGTAVGEGWRRGRFRAPYLRDVLWERGYAVDTVETATVWSNVPRTLAALENAIGGALAADGERVHRFTHLSHLYPTGASVYTTYAFRRGADADETLARWRIIKGAASAAIVGAGATISHQHGVGTDHAAFVAAEKGPLGMRALAAALGAFDGPGVMNPGKLLAGDDARS